MDWLEQESSSVTCWYFCSRWMIVSFLDTQTFITLPVNLTSRLLFASGTPILSLQIHSRDEELIFIPSLWQPDKHLGKHLGVFECTILWICCRSESEAHSVSYRAFIYESVEPGQKSTSKQVLRSAVSGDSIKDRHYVQRISWINQPDTHFGFYSLRCVLEMLEVS